MAKETNKLAEAFAVKDELERLLANLEKRKADGSITERQYTTTRKEYEQRLTAATSEIERIKITLKEQLEANQREVETYKRELGKLEVKYRVGELPLQKYRSSDRELRAKIEQLETEAEELKSFIEPKPSAGIGVTAKKPGIAAPGLPPFSKVATLAKQIKLPRGERLALISGAVLLVAIVVLGVVVLMPKIKEVAEFPREQPEEGAGLPPGQYEAIEVRIPVDIEGAANVGSLHLEIVYDQELLHAIEVENGTAVGDAMLEYNVDSPGRVIVGIITSHGISGDGSVAIVVFQVEGEAEMTTPLSLENIAAHDAATMLEISASAAAGSFKAEDRSFVAPKLFFM